jgi:hypothetical protein
MHGAEAVQTGTVVLLHQVCWGCGGACRQSASKYTKKLSINACIVWFISIMRGLPCQDDSPGQPCISRALFADLLGLVKLSKTWLLQAFAFSSADTNLQTETVRSLLCTSAALTFGLFKAVAQELGASKSSVDHAWGDLVKAGHMPQATIRQGEAHGIVGSALGPNAAGLTTAAATAAAPPPAPAAAAAFHATTAAAAGGTASPPLLLYNGFCR